MEETVKVFRNKKGTLVIVEWKSNKATVKFEGENKISLEIKYRYDLKGQPVFDAIKDVLDLNELD